MDGPDLACSKFHSFLLRFEVSLAVYHEYLSAGTSSGCDNGGEEDEL